MRGGADPYFNWLCVKIGLDRNIPGRNYTELISSLHKEIFRPKLDMDRNRSMDGLQLRTEFITEHGPLGSATNRGPCSMLEFLIAISKRMSFLMYDESRRFRTEFFFWRLIDNLGLSKVTDENWYQMNGEFFVEDAVYRINDRMYLADGSGGIFPLKHPEQDQRKVEIWYQMNAWLMENYGGTDEI